MRQYLFLLVAFFFLGHSLQAQQRAGVLRVRFDDRHPLTLAVNDRRFPKIANSLTVGDLPRVRNRIDVYEFRAYKDGGGHAKLIFSGNVKVRKGTVTYCIVDRSTGRVKVYARTIQNGDNYADPIFDEGASGLGATQSEELILMNATLTADGLTALERDVHTYLTDADKGAFLQDTLRNQSYTVAQLKHMLQWFGSETSRLEFAKWSYPRISDPETFLGIEEVFVYDQSKQELRTFVRAQ